MLFLTEPVAAEGVCVTNRTILSNLYSCPPPYSPSEGGQMPAISPFGGGEGGGLLKIHWAISYKPAKSCEAVSPSTFDIPLFDIRYSIPPPDSCSDLQIDSIRVLEYKKKCYVVEYTLSNNGTAPAPLFGAKRKLTDNIILRAYFSGDRRVNRGDAEAGAAYIKKGTGILLPGESYTGVMEVDRRLETNYISIVLLQVDAFSTLRECDETNNVSWMILD